MTSQICKADNENISNLKWEEKFVGRSIKSSKRKLRWDFEVSGQPYFVELYDSKLSGKKKVVANGNVILPAQVIRGLFNFSFYLENNVISLNQNGNTFECRINNFVFSHLVEVEKNRKELLKECSKTLQIQKDLEKLEDSVKNENKENTSDNKQTTSRKPTNKSIEGVQSSNLEDFFKKVSKNSETSENLIDFNLQDGTRPSKINILDLSPLQSPKKETLKNENNSQTNGSHVVTEKSLVKPEESQRNETPNMKDINDLFETIEISQPKKELSAIDKLKIAYQSSFKNDEVKKIDQIYNVFGNLYAEPKKSSSVSSNMIIPEKKEVETFKRGTSVSDKYLHQNLKNLYPTFDDMNTNFVKHKTQHQSSEKVEKDEKNENKTSSQTINNNIFDLFK